MTSLFLAALFLAAPAKGPAKAAPANVADTDPPTIIHTPLADVAPNQELQIDAEIRDQTGVFEPVLSWRHQGEADWRTIKFAPTGGKDKFRASLSPSDVSEDLEYFIEAYDTEGNGPTRVGSPGQPMRVAVKVQKIIVAKEPVPEPAGPAPAAAVQIAPEPEGGGMPIGPLATIGAGVVALGVGAVMWFGASGEAADLSAKYPGGIPLKPEDESVAADIASKGQLGSILMIAGAVIGGGGTAWFLVAPAQSGAALQLQVNF